MKPQKRKNREKRSTLRRNPLPRLSDAELGKFASDKIIEHYFGFVGLCFAQDQKVQEVLLRTLAKVPGTGVEIEKEEPGIVQ